VGADLLALGRTREAMPVLEQALRELEAEATDPLDVAGCRLSLARALAALGRDPARARALATQARAAWADHAGKTGTSLHAPQIAAAEQLVQTLP
jgi:hypothetical protein